MEQVAKTIKLFIGGEFPRTESGRTFPVYKYGTKEVFAQLCLASKKDVRNAVEVAKAAQSGWESKTAYNRGQILYRTAEMLEARKKEFSELFQNILGWSDMKAQGEISGAIQAFVYYAGFTDKFQQMIGSVNPVAGPHHNFTTPEAVGVVTLIGEENFSFTKTCAQMASILASGNSLVALLPFEGSVCVSALGEVLATSDLPKGVVNLLTGKQDELYLGLASHMEVQSCAYFGQKSEIKQKIQESACGNLKRVVTLWASDLNLENILSFVEYKTVWHPVGY